MWAIVNVFGIKIQVLTMARPNFWPFLKAPFHSCSFSITYIQAVTFTDLRLKFKNKQTNKPCSCLMLPLSSPPAYKLWGSKLFIWDWRVASGNLEKSLNQGDPGKGKEGKTWDHRNIRSFPFYHSHISIPAPRDTSLKFILGRPKRISGLCAGKQSCWSLREAGLSNKDSPEQT